MRKLVMVGLGVLLSASVWAAGVPAQINYQGTLRTKNVPTNDKNTTMRFRITDSNQNGKVLWTSSSMTVPVTNGLFSVQLTPTGIDWQNVTPLLEVEVNGQTLTPSEPISATVYAQMSQSIVDGAVTPAKVAPGYGLVPAGGIVMFDTTCPPGWTRFAALDNQFPMGGSTYGVMGGTKTHSHSIQIDGSHNHGGITGGPNQNTSVNAGANAAVPTQTHVHGIPVDGAHDHGGFSGLSSSIPPYLQMIFCQKQ